MAGSNAGIINNHQSPFQAIVAGPFQQLAFTGSNGQSTPLLPTTTLVWLFATQDVWINIGENPTSSVVPGQGSFLLRGGFYRPFALLPSGGISYKISALRDVTSGTLDIHEGA